MDERTRLYNRRAFSVMFHRLPKRMLGSNPGAAETAAAAKKRKQPYPARPTPTAVDRSQSTDPENSNQQHLVLEFDKNRAYGPRIGITREQRLHRADRLGVPVSDAVRGAVTHSEATLKHRYDLSQCLSAAA